MSMFANRIEDGHPMCPMTGCDKPIEIGEGAVGEFSQAAMARAFMHGLVESPSGMVLVHKACIGKEGN